jgi:guanylate kinase
MGLPGLAIIARFAPPHASHWLEDAFSLVQEGQAHMILCVCGPSGVGKGTMIKLLLADYPTQFRFTISHTTRQPRAGEVHGRDYFFTSREEMANMQARGEFVELAVVHNNVYGTSRRAIDAVTLEERKIALLDMDQQGVRQIKHAMPIGSTRIVGVLPPNMQVLEERLRGRNTESNEEVGRRLLNAKTEIDVIPTIADAVIVNRSTWDQGYPELKRLVQAWYGLR